MPNDGNEEIDFASMLSDAPATTLESAPGGDPAPAGETTQQETSPEGGKVPATTLPKPGDEGKAEVKAEVVPPKVATPPAGPTTEERLAATQEQIAELLRAQTTERPERDTPKKQPEGPKFTLRTPPQLVQAMASEDPAERQAAIDNLVNGVANTVWNEVQRQMAEMTKNIPTIVQRHTQQHNAVQQVFTDYYGKFPEHKAMGPYVQSVAMELSRTLKPQSWTPEFRDAVGAEVKKRLAAAAGLTVPPEDGKKQPTPKTPKTPPFQTQGSTRVATAGPNAFLDSVGA